MEPTPEQVAQARNDADQLAALTARAEEAERKISIIIRDYDAAQKVQEEEIERLRARVATAHAEGRDYMREVMLRALATPPAIPGHPVWCAIHAGYFCSCLYVPVGLGGQATPPAGEASEAETIRSQAHAEGRQAGEWQPIETAPKDGELILVYDAAWCGGSPRMSVSYWQRYAVISNGTIEKRGDFSGVTKATHWMPLPAPPLATEARS